MTGSTKGVSMSVETVGKLLIVVFIIGVIVILLMTFLPEFSTTLCLDAQSGEINEIVNDAVQARATTTTKKFTVHNCVEELNFDDRLKEDPEIKLECNGGKRCYEFLVIGQNQGNCEAVGLDCTKYKGTIREFPAGTEILEIGGISPLKKGSYSVEIGPYSIGFKER